MTRFGRWSVITSAGLLLGTLFTVPAAVAQGGGGADKAAGGARMERFLIVSTNPKQNAKPIVLGFGPIHAKGVDNPVNAHKDVFRFPDGSVVVRHKRATQANHHDPVTCLTTFSERGVYRVVSGTGAYAGAHGHGHYRVHVQFVACPHQRPQAFSQEIRAHGPLTL